MDAFESKTIKKDISILLSQMSLKIYNILHPLNIEIAVTDEPVAFSDRLNLKYKPFEIGDCWAKKNFQCGWMHLTGEIPEDRADKETVLLVDISGEGCLFDKNGTPIRGLTNGSSIFDRSCGDPIKQVLFLSEIEHDSKHLDIWIDIASNDLFGIGHGGLINVCNFAYLNENVRSLSFDIMFLLEYIDSISTDNPQYYSILYALEKAVSYLSSSFTDEEIQKAKECLKKELKRKNGDNSFLTLYASGHAHLDLAWLWPIRETKRKVGRTFSNVISNMRRYDDYIFGASQAQQFVWLKELYPILFEEVKERVKEKRIEVQGGMWVEPDTNITGGESLVRQILYGKKFFKEEFDVDCRTCHLPDAFGFTGSLPQILKKSGIDYFLTTKLSWCEHYEYPHNSFIWEGIDGTEVIAHMPPANSYATSASPKVLLESQKNYSEKGLIDKAILLYGIGDGGGGPGRDHLEKCLRAKDFLGLPKVKQSRTIEFFDELKKDKDKLSKWVGELYLDRHQGTLTSISENKYFNRLLENKLSLLEKLSSINLLDGKAYKKEEIDNIWTEVLLYQFHDILPGSSIRRVYNESQSRYKVLLEEVNTLITEQTRDDSCLTVFNPSSFERCEYIEHNSETYYVNAKPLSFTKLEKTSDYSGISASENELENELIKCTFDYDGLVTIYDKENNRLAVNESNLLNVYNEFADCWDETPNFKKYLCGKFNLVSHSSYVEGIKAVRECIYEYNNSTLKQKIILFKNSKLLIFESELDWHEDQKMLRVEFNPLVKSNYATCDIQFGNIKRPTVTNTVKDYGMYEVSMQKYVDISDNQYGVSVINDSKYACNVKDSKISINLLRSQNYPCIDSDKGIHSFKYALYPHSGSIEESNTVKEAISFNNPLLVSHNKETDSFISLQSNGVVVDTIKKAEDSNDLVLRLYEPVNISEKIKMVISNNQIKKVYESDLMENISSDNLLKKGSIELEFKPFEIKTLVLKR